MGIQYDFLSDIEGECTEENQYYYIFSTYLKSKNTSLENIRDPFSCKFFKNYKKKKIEDENNNNKDYFLFKSLIENIQKQKKYSDINKELKKVENIKNNLLRRLSHLALALNVNNLGWGNQVVKKILKINEYDLMLNPIRQQKNEEEFVVLLEILLKEYSEKSKDILKAQMLANLFYHYGQSNSYKVLVNRFNSLWPLLEVREIIKKTMFAGEFFNFWYIHLLNRTSDNNLRALMRGMLDNDTIERADISQFWVFDYYYPGDPKLRNIITQKLYKAWESKSIKDQLIILKVLNNGILKRDLAKLNNYFDKPLFQIKREFFKNNLSNPILTEYSLFNLTILGDTKLKNLKVLF